MAREYPWLLPFGGIQGGLGQFAPLYQTAVSQMADVSHVFGKEQLPRPSRYRASGPDPRSCYPESWYHRNVWGLKP